MISKGRKWLRVLLILALVFATLWVVAPRVVAPILRQRLQAMVARHLRAQLTTDSVTYKFPYGVRLHNAALVAADESGRTVDLLRVEDIELVLARMPWGREPLLIERIIVHKPSVHLIFEPSGLVGFPRLVRDTPGTVPSELPTTALHDKPSDYFRLKLFSIRGGQVVVENRRLRSDLPATAWRNIDIDLNIEPQSGSLYGWQIIARNDPAAVLNARGQVDVDRAQVEVEKLALKANVSRDQQQEQLPPRLQELMKQFRMDGTFSLLGQATIPINNLDRARYEATAQLSGSSATMSNWGGRLDSVFVKVTAASEPPDAAPPATAASRPRPAAPTTTLHLDQLELISGPTKLRVEKGVATIDPLTRTWRVTNLLGRLEIGEDHSALPGPLRNIADSIDLSGQVALTAAIMGPLAPLPDRPAVDQLEYQFIAYPRELSLKPKGFAQPITGASGTIRATTQVISLENVEASCGPDLFFVRQARIPLENIASEVQIQEITGTATLSGKILVYPRPLDLVAEHIRPMGTWAVTGNWARRVKSQAKPEFWFDISADKAGASLLAGRIPLSDLRCTLSVSPQAIDIHNFIANTLGGELQLEGQIKPGKPAAYGGKVWVRDLDLKRFALALAEGNKSPMKLSGKGNVNARLTGNGPATQRSAAQSIEAAGRFEILEGEFWEMPTLKEIVDGSKVSRDGLGNGQAAGSFTISNSTVRMRDAIVSSPVLGIQGGGDVGFDGKLGLKVIAAPLGDWKEQIRRTRIPIVSDVTGELLGAFQKILNSTSKTLLYHFHVEGTTKQPRITPVPAPILTENLAKLFDGMIKGKPAKDLSPEK